MDKLIILLRLHLPQARLALTLSVRLAFCDLYFVIDVITDAILEKIFASISRFRNASRARFDKAQDEARLCRLLGHEKAAAHAGDLEEEYQANSARYGEAEARRRYGQDYDSLIRRARGVKMQAIAESTLNLFKTVR